jgi:hypothetical protein
MTIAPRPPAADDSALWTTERFDHRSTADRPISVKPQQHKMAAVGLRNITPDRRVRD